MSYSLKLYNHLVNSRPLIEICSLKSLATLYTMTAASSLQHTGLVSHVCIIRFQFQCKKYIFLNISQFYKNLLLTL